MTYVCTLISAKATGLSAELVSAAAAALGADRPQWLAEGEACDLPLGDRPAEEQQAELAALLNGVPVDMVIQPIANRRKKLLVADMDSTIIEQECIDEMGAMLGIGERIAEITERAMRGELEFEGALRERVALLEGLSENELQRVFDERLTLTPGARTLVATMQANGATCALLSGGFTFFTSRVAHAAGFRRDRANTLLIEDGKLTGKVAEPIFGKQGKLDTLVTLTKELGLVSDETMAVGDGANDLAMITAAGLGVAYHAKPVVAEAAPARINHADLSALLFIQGYDKASFTA